MAKGNKKIIKENNRSVIRAGDVAEIRISDISTGGQGIGRLHGLTVFVPEAVPGDLALVRIDRIKSRYAVADLQGLISPSADRTIPHCAVFGDCGGCSLQMMAYAAQLAMKQTRVIETVNRIGQMTDAASKTQPIIGMDEPWQYRSKVQFPVAGSAENPEIGFYATGSHRIVKTVDCPIQPPVCDAIRHLIVDHLREWSIEPYQEETHKGLLRHVVIRIGFFTGEVMVGLVINGKDLPGQDVLCEKLRALVAAGRDPRLPPLRLTCVYLNINRAQTNVIQSDECVLLYGRLWIEEKILGLHYRISPLSFFQVNPHQTQRLYQTVLDLAALTGSETVLDLYCGTGSISLLLARRAKAVLGMEIIPEAIADAKINASINGIANVNFVTGKAEDLLPQMLAGGHAADLVVLDPPRKGCDPALLDALITADIKKLIYVSCNPATLARDIAILRSGDYQVRLIQPVDMFPWTNHVETVVLMSKVQK